MPLIGWGSLGQGYFLVLAPTRPPTALSGGAPGGSSPPRGRRPGTGRQAGTPWTLDSTEEQGWREKQAAVGGRRPAPPHLSLFRGSLMQGLVPTGAIGQVDSIEEEVAEFRAFFSTRSGPHCTAAPGAQPCPRWLSACDSPVPLGRCCPVGKSPVCLEGGARFTLTSDTCVTTRAVCHCFLQPVSTLTF